MTHFSTGPISCLLIVCLMILTTGQLRAIEFPTVQNFQVEMSDGIHLNTNVYYPQDGADSWPVVIYRTPYNITGDNISGWANGGMVAVCQDTRGRYASEGIDMMFRDDGWGPDHTDGLDTVNWILSQPWCNGRIGSVGGSARGITQNMLAGSLPDSMRCMYIVVAPADFYGHAAFPGGAFRKYDIEGWLHGQGSPHMIDSLYVHPNDDEWWSWYDMESRHHLETIPTYQVGGWYDLFSQGNVDSFTGLQLGGGPGAAGNQKLMMGPWTHGVGSGSAGELFYPDASLSTPSTLIGSQSEWFSEWLMAEPTGIMDLPSVAYYVMGDVDDPGAPGNEWRSCDLWPPPAVERSFYFHEGGQLSLSPPAGIEEPDTYQYNPLDPVPTLGGANLSLLKGPYDQRPVTNRSDVLVYQTELLTEPVEIAGPVAVEVYVSSDRLDTDFTAKLCDVYPDGRQMLVCDGVIRGRHRTSMSTEELMVPGAIYQMTIDLWDTAIIFNAGHRILVAISSSNYPRYDANPNTGEPFMQQTTTLVATNTFYHDFYSRSRLIVRCPDPLQDVVWLPEARESLTCYPNPFVHSTTIKYQARPGAPLRLAVYDGNGRLLRRLVNSDLPGQESSRCSWDGRGDNGRLVPSGAYWLRWQSGGHSQQTRLLVIR